MRVIALIGMLSGDVSPEIFQCGMAYGELKIGIRIGQPAPQKTTQRPPRYFFEDGNRAKKETKGQSTIHFFYN